MTSSRPTHPDPEPEDDDSMAETDPLPKAGPAAGAGVRPLESLSEEVLELLQRNMSERWFQPGEPLMRQGDPGGSLMVIAEGEVEVSVEQDGQRHLLRRVGAGQIMGEMALLTKEPRMA